MRQICHAQTREGNLKASKTPTKINKHNHQSLPRVWQAHIQKIPDYLKHGPDQWWNERDDGSIEFLDGPSQDEVKPCGPHLSHFRSTTIQDLQQQLNTEWEQIKVTPEILPVMKLRDEEGKLVYPAQQPEEPIENDDEHSPEMDNSNAGT